MAVDERSRHELYVWLEQAAGRERADTLMSMLPPVGWADVATKSDLEHLRAATKTDLEHLRAATKSDLEHLRAATKTDITALGDQLRAEWRQALLEQTRTMIVANFTVMIALVSLTYAAVRLG